jgi:hypothetical protein
MLTYTFTFKRGTQTRIKSIQAEAEQWLQAWVSSWLVEGWEVLDCDIG